MAHPVIHVGKSPGEEESIIRHRQTIFPSNESCSITISLHYRIAQPICQDGRCMRRCSLGAYRLHFLARFHLPASSIHGPSGFQSQSKVIVMRLFCLDEWSIPFWQRKRELPSPSSSHRGRYCYLGVMNCWTRPF